MQLLKKLSSISVTSKTGNTKLRTQGLFHCPQCKQEVVKDLNNGKKMEVCSPQCKTNTGKHNLSGKPIYTTWNNMKIRCTSGTSKAVKYYFEKGITFDPKWETFEGFYEDMGLTYRDGLTLDRIDPNKGYNKENCQWITMEENRIKDRIKAIAKYTLEGEFIVSYSSAADACRAGEAKNSTSLTRVARGERETYLGYVWKFL